MNFKITTAIIIGLFSFQANATILQIKSAEGINALDGTHDITINQTTRTWISNDGKIKGKKINKNVISSSIGSHKIYESTQEIMTNDQTYIVQFLGKQEGDAEDGYVEIRQNNKVLGKGIYSYKK